MNYLLAISCLFALISCKQPISQSGSQGIKGKVLWLEGNFMPGPGQKNSGKPVQREILIYELVQQTQATREGSLYTEIPTDLVKKVTSDENGIFTIDLPAGAYSVFTQEEDGVFANVQDGEGNINPIEVKENQYTEVVLKVNYKAVY